MAKIISKTVAAASSSTKAFDPADYVFHIVEVAGGKKFEEGSQFECVKAGINRYGKPYLMINVDGIDDFIDPKNVTVLKPMAAAKAALVKSELEAAREAVIMLGGLIKNETEKAVLIQHHGWFKAKWFPKAFVTKLGDHEDGQQSIFEVPAWKVKADMGPDALAALEELQSGYEKMLEPAKPEPKAGQSLVTGKTTIIRRKAK